MWCFGLLLLFCLGVFADTDCQCEDPRTGSIVYEWECSDWLMNQECGPSGCDGNFCTASCTPSQSLCHGGLTPYGIAAIVGLCLCVVSTCIRVARRSTRIAPTPTPAPAAPQPAQQQQPPPPPPQQRQAYQPPQLQQPYQQPQQHPQNMVIPQPQSLNQPLLSGHVPETPPPSYSSIGASAAHPLHGAAHTGDETRCAQLLAQGVPVDLLSPSGFTPLQLSASAGHEACVRLFLQTGANVHASTPQGHTALHLAALKGYTSICILLVNGGSSLTALTLKNSTPLGLALFGKHEDTAQALRNMGATK